MKYVSLLVFLPFVFKGYCQDTEKGALSAENKSILIEELGRLSNSKIDGNKTIVINFFDLPEHNPNGSCIDHYTSDVSYVRFFKRNSNAIQFFITQKGYNYAKKNVFEDKSNVLKELLFLNSKACGNYTIIKPDGQFITYFGEYRQENIPKFIRKN